MFERGRKTLIPEFRAKINVVVELYRVRAGTVTDTIDRRRVKISFDSPDLDVLDVASRMVIPLTGAIARPTLYVRDDLFLRL